MFLTDVAIAYNIFVNQGAITLLPTSVIFILSRPPISDELENPIIHIMIEFVISLMRHTILRQTVEITNKKEGIKFATLLSLLIL
jgi:hypothetical protein